MFVLTTGSNRYEAKTDKIAGIDNATIPYFQ